MKFLNPFYQKDIDHYAEGTSSITTSNVIFPMTDYVSISLFKDHFFKWNQEHQLELQTSSGSPMTKMQRVMVREMDLHIENSELKKLIKSMCEEMSKMQPNKPTESEDLSQSQRRNAEKVLQKQESNRLNRKQSIEIVYQKDKDATETKYLSNELPFISIVNLQDDEDEKKTIYEEDEGDDADSPGPKTPPKENKDDEEVIKTSKMASISPEDSEDKEPSLPIAVMDNIDNDDKLEEDLEQDLEAAESLELVSRPSESPDIKDQGKKNKDWNSQMSIDSDYFNQEYKMKSSITKEGSDEEPNN